MTTPRGRKKKDLYYLKNSFNPIDIKKDILWLYTYPNGKGIIIVHEIRERGRWIRTDEFRIPLYKFMNKSKELKPIGRGK